MRVVVTGAAGFIGSNLVHALNKMGVDHIVAVDDLTDGAKFVNLRGTRLIDYFDRDEFQDLFAKGALGQIDVVFHQGACSDTMQHDGRAMMRTNYRFSKDMLDICALRGTRLIYASSAAVYGDGPVFVEAPENERPLNVYGYSKLVFDDVVRSRLSQSALQVVGLRYFNVYGPREQHKARMASVAFHNFNEFKTNNSVQLFGEYGGYGPGMHQRDFVSVDDVVSVNLWFLMHPQCNGVFNVGTGRAQPFNDVAAAVVNSCRRWGGLPKLHLEQMVSQGLLEYKPMPDALIGKYQCHTQADLVALRRIGCDIDFADVAAGVDRYVDWLTSST